MPIAFRSFPHTPIRRQGRFGTGRRLFVVHDGPRRSRLWALLQQRCPRCREGKLFEKGMTMYQSCPVCHLVWERERGYFLGAMYFSYALAIVFLVLILILLKIVLPDWDPRWVGLIAIVIFLPLVPMVFRYSRTMWLYFDRWVWPQDEPPGT
jgi:uncharacterized protein (DUF983 family)